MALFYYFWLQRVFIEVLWAYGQGMEDPSSPTRDQTLSPALDVVSESHSVVSTLATPWTEACKVPLSMGFSRQEY